MSAAWCCPQELVQPEMLMRIPPTSARPSSSRRSPIAGETTALGDGEVAGVGAGAGDDVAGELGAGLGHADRVEPLEQRRELLVGEVAEHDVLAVREPDLGAELPLDRGERSELVGGDVAELGPGVGRHGAVGGAAHDVGVVPPHVR
jgi:hypothetical protein